MRTLALELKKEKRTGVIPTLLVVGILGALYAFANFIVRGDTLLKLPLPPMDVLLTQLYGMIVIMNLFGIVIAACLIFNMEYKGNAIRKVYTLPVRVALVYICKFLILFICLFIAIAFQNAALAQIGITKLPAGAFDLGVLIRFAAYSFVTSLPVLSLMILVSSRSENMWIPLGIGVAGFLSGMALAMVKSSLVLLHPFVIMLRPAVAMSAIPEMQPILFAVFETFLFAAIGILLSKHLKYE